MQIKGETFDVGVIVGRFQVPELHHAHRQLIEHVCAEHEKVVIFLGVSPLWVTRENPLDFESRKQMILAAFPKVTVLYVSDHVSDYIWSKNLDRAIVDVLTPSQKPVLYGGRSSFIEHYEGKFETRELEPDAYLSGTDIRRAVSREVKASKDFRAGVVWAAHAGFPRTITCVDVAVFDEAYKRILLARKPGENQYRLIGGFSDPRSESFEQDARREVSEEAHIEITEPQYVRSFKIDDWRYRRESDQKIKTLLFHAKLMFGTPRPDDDIEELKWFDVGVTSDSLIKAVVPNHRAMIGALFHHAIPYMETSSGMPITAELVNRLAAEADKGYDVDEILQRRKE